MNRVLGFQPQHKHPAVDSLQLCRRCQFPAGQFPNERPQRWFVPLWSYLSSYCVCDMNMWADYIHNWHETFVWHPITCWIENCFSSGKAHYKLGRLDHSVCVYRCAFMPVTQKCWRVSKIKPLHHLFQMVSFNSTKFNPKSMSHKVAETMDPTSSPWRTGPPTLLRCRNPRQGQRRAADPTTPPTWPLRWFTDSHWLCQNSYWKWPVIVDFPIKKWWFSIVMWLFTRG